MREKKTEKKVYEYIKDQILDGVLMPQAKLIEMDIANDLGVSRSPVRAAIKQLAEDGYVQSEPYKGAVVNGMKVGSKEFVETLQVFELLFIQYFFQVENRHYSVPYDKIEEKVVILQNGKKNGLNHQQKVVLGSEITALFFSSQQNQYYKSLVIKMFREIVGVQISELPKDSDYIFNLFASHFQKMITYGRRADFPLLRREIRIVVNQLVLEVIDQQELGMWNKHKSYE